MNRWMVDFDGVVADLQGAFVRGVNAEYGTHYEVEEINQWFYWERQSKKHAQYVWKVLYPDADWFLANVEPYEDAIEALCDLLTDIAGVVDQSDYPDSFGPPVQIITARTEEQTPMVVTWLEKYLPEYLSLPVHSVGNVPVRKSELCQRHRLNVVVEDGSHNLRQMNYRTQKLFLVSRPWNQGDKVPPRTVRVPGLQQAINQVAMAR